MRRHDAAFEQRGLRNNDGVHLADVAGQFATPAGAFRKIEDPARRSQLAMELFGRSGPAMLVVSRSCFWRWLAHKKSWPQSQ